MNRISLILLLSIFLLDTAIGQTPTFKETKATTFVENYNNGDRFIIHGERTFVTLKSWNKNSISVKAEIVSKYKNQEIAKSDLEKIDIGFKRSGKKIIYSNAIRIAKPQEKPLANLKVYIEVFVPVGAIVEIENHFGEINIEASLEKLTIDSNFTQISINDSDGYTSIVTKYGDTEINGLEANLNLFADRSNLILKKLIGQINLDVKYSEVDLFPLNGTIFEEFKAKFSPINISLFENYNQALDVVCNGCNINYKSNIKSTFINDQNTDHIVINQGAKNNGTIISEVEDILIK